MFIYLIVIAWMWALGGGLFWLFCDELVPDVSRKWKIIALCVTWPITLPTVIGWYSATPRR